MPDASRRVPHAARCPATNVAGQISNIIPVFKGTEIRHPGGRPLPRTPIHAIIDSTLGKSIRVYEQGPPPDRGARGARPNDVLSTQDVLSDDERSILDAIVDSPDACPDVDGLQQHTGIDNMILYVKILVLLESSGWLSIWDREGEPTLVTLAPLGAERLGVVLVDGPTSGVLAWSRDAASARGRRPGHAARLRTEANHQLLDSAPDPQPTGPEAWEAYEEVLARFRPRLHLIADLPFPAVFLTGSPAHPWREYDRRNPLSPHVGRRLEGTCECCGGEKLRASHICGRCMRWGLDGAAARNERLAGLNARAG